MQAPGLAVLNRRVVGENVWLGYPDSAEEAAFENLRPHLLSYEILESEEAVARAQFEEIERAASEKDGDLVVVLLGGRGAQALYRLLGKLAESDQIDTLLGRLHLVTQDALAPIRMDNSLSFVQDFKRLLGEQFFSKVKSFTPMQTETVDLEGELVRYLERLESLGGIDLFFLGLGPELGGMSHLAYIRPGSGARAGDLSGVIPISESILEHHINKFKIGGSAVTETDEQECRAATHILTLGPAAILGARRVVQSVVDAATAPGKSESYQRILNTKVAADHEWRAAQLDENPGLWLRMHPNVRSLILADVLV